MKLVANFTHTPGLHCGSTAMRDVLNCIGVNYSEAMCFGLGSGLGFFYGKNPSGDSPSRLFHGRTATLERDLCTHLALDFEQGSDDDGERAWHTAQKYLDADLPLVLSVDLSCLPYYHTRTRFPGHRVVLAGYDDERVFLGDTGFSGLQEVSHQALRAARAVAAPPFPLHNEWLVVKSTRAPRPLAEAVRIALRENAQGMNQDRTPFQGIMAMEKLAEEFESWADLPDWEFCVRFGYQIIERRGTGGGLFRKMYANYLRESEALIAAMGTAKLADTMQEIADEWTRLALLLKRISEEKDRSLFSVASQAVRRLALREESFWGKVLDVV